MNDIKINIFFAIFVSVITTILIRTLPIFFLSNRTLPIFLRNWLSIIPPAILSSIVSLEIMTNNVTNSLGILIVYPASFITFIVGILTKNLLLTIIISIFSYLFFQLL